MSAVTTWWDRVGRKPGSNPLMSVLVTSVTRGWRSERGVEERGPELGHLAATEGEAAAHGGTVAVEHVAEVQAERVGVELGEEQPQAHAHRVHEARGLVERGARVVEEHSAQVHRVEDERPGAVLQVEQRQALAGVRL